MAKEAKVLVRMDADIRRDAEALFKEFGMTLPQAFNIFAHQALLERRIPFIIGEPKYNAQTDAELLEALKTTGKGVNKRFTDVDALFTELLEDDEDA